MLKSVFFTIVSVLSFSTLFGQSLDSYKYILIPNKYEFQKEQDQYQVNSLVKFLFNQAGYTAFLASDDLPKDLKSNNCLAAKAYVDDVKSLLRTKTVLRLEDCSGKTILVTKEGKSKIKEYKKAYHESIRNSFAELKALTYNYVPKNNEDKPIERNTAKPKKTIEPERVKEVMIKEKIAEFKKKSKPNEANMDVEATKNIKKKKLGEPEEKIEMIKLKPAIINLLGNYELEGWGSSKIIKKGNDFVIKGGDENIEIATIYKTSKPNIYIVKWLAFKQPQLLQIDKLGTLRVDSKSGVKYYKRIN